MCTPVYRPSFVVAEWEEGRGSGRPPPEVEVEVREGAADLVAPPRAHAAAPAPPPPGGRVLDAPPTASPPPPALVVRAEEVLLVALVLALWAAAVALFFNRWGKIRMLEPYQPKFRQQPHRPSCPMAAAAAAAPAAPGLPPALSQKCARMSFSKYNVNALTDPLSALPSPIIRRLRQHSVFAGSSAAPGAQQAAPRRARSAADIRQLAAGGGAPHRGVGAAASSLSGSLTPILTRGSADRRPSIITIERAERPVFIPRRRPSVAVERTQQLPPCRARRASCCPSAADRQPARSHRNFASLEVARTPSGSCSLPQPTISFETPLESSYESGEAASYLVLERSRPKVSRSFEQPPADRPKPERMATSLDVSASFSLDRRFSIPEEPDRASPIFITLDETRITAPLLESLKSSDV